MIEPGQPPRELNRLDSKNWTPTPPEVEDQLIAALRQSAERIDALIIMDQVDVAETGAVTRRVLEAVAEIGRPPAGLRMLADSRRSLRVIPGSCLKMNRAELGVLLGRPAPARCRTDEDGGLGSCAATRPRGIHHAGGARACRRQRRRRGGPLAAAAGARPDRHRRGRRLRSPPIWPPPWPPALALDEVAATGQRGGVGRDPPTRHHRHGLEEQIAELLQIARP